MTEVSLPPVFVERMKRLLGGDADAFFAGYERPLRRGLRVNTLKCEVDTFRALFPHPLEPSPFAEDAFYLDATHKAGADPLHHAGAYYMQEPSAASAVTVLAPKKGEYILDLCAAPGGKSTQIAAALGGTGLLWCNEYIKSRAQILLQNLERLGVRNAVVTNADTTPLCGQLEGCFDAVLADVPCSGEGMFRKEEVALTQWSEALVEECAARGESILHNASLAVREGGRIVYSTCTFAPEENELQIAHFLQSHPDFELLDCSVSFGRPALTAKQLFAFEELPDDLPLEHCRRIFPADGGEGHFIALLRKRGNAPRRSHTAPKAKPDDAVKAAEALWKDCFKNEPNGRFVRFGDTVRLLPEDLPTVQKLSVLSAGIPVGTVAKNRLEPHHALFASADPASCKRVVDLPLSDERTIAFLHGEEIPVSCDKGYALVTIEGIPCGFGKVSGGVLKNKYPKGLRRL